MTARIMIVDDEQAIRDSLQGLFEDEGYLVFSAASGEECIAKLRKQSVDCVLLDIWMPGIDGLETLNRIQQIDKCLPVIMMSGHATIDTAVKATRQGAFDFLEKPLSSERMLILVRNAVQKRQLEHENINLKENQQQGSRQELVGESKVIRDVRNLIQRVAAADAPVLILGEHGTGKAVAARMIHACSKRAKAPFIDVNAAGIPTGRMDSELFGHEKGAFPGALHAQRGRFEAAHTGTLFFDEVMELSLSAQAKILRVLQEKSVQRLGNPTPQPADVRLLAASARDLEDEMRQEKLREDFYYRLNVVAIRMPPLRERMEDLSLLVEALASEQAGSLGGGAIHFSDDALQMLRAYNWPGNVRELRNYIERCHILMPGEEVTAANMLSPEHSAAISARPANRATSSYEERFHEAREAFERQYLLHHLEQYDWNISRTASEIGMERSQLHRKIKAFDLVQPKKDSA